MPAITYLEASEEITSVVDRLRKLREQEAVLVVPKSAVLLQSIVNLKLLQRQATSLGKKVTFVTTDRMGKNLAAQVGFPVYDSLEDLEAGRAFRAARESRTTHDIVGQSPGPASARPYEPEQEERGKPIVQPIGERATPPAQVSPSAGSKRPGRALLSRLRSRLVLPPGLLRRRGLLWVAGGGLLLVGGLLLLFVFPTATVHLTPKADALTIEEDVIVDTSATKVSTASPVVIPGKSVERTVEGSGTYQATGKKDVGNKATGNITLRNETDSDQTLVGGTRLVAGGLQFRTNNAVTVPKSYISPSPPFNKIPGETQVSITADSGGSQYNLSGARFTIPGLPADRQDFIYGQGSTSGGTTREVTAVSEQDVAQARQKLSDQLLAQAKEELAEEEEDLRIVDDAVQETLNVTPRPAVGEEGGEFTLSGTLTLKTIAFSEKDLRQALVESAKRSGEEERDILVDEEEEAEVSVNRENLDLDSGTLPLQVRLEAFSARHYEPGDVAGEVRGKTISEAEEFFRAEEAIAEVRVSIWPSFKSRLPYFANRIKINIETPKQ